MPKLIAESTSVPVSTGTPGRWRATLLTIGQGSSGNWLEETVRRDGPHALKKGSKCFVTHNRLENGEPDPFRMWGTLADDAYFEEGVGLVGDIDVLPSWRDRVEEVAPHTALSVYLMGESDEEGNITEILDDVQNGVDLVVFPGRPGSGLVEKLYESAKPLAEKTSTASVVVENEQIGMTMEKDVEERFDALTALIQGLTEARAQDAKAEADANAVDAEATKRVEAVVASLSAVESARADLLPSQVASLTESAKRGEDVAPAIESAKAIATEARETFAGKDDSAESGRLGESHTGSALDLGKVLG